MAVQGLDTNVLDSLLDLSWLGFWQWDIKRDSLELSSGLRAILPLPKDIKKYNIEHLWGCFEAEHLPKINSDIQACLKNSKAFQTELSIHDESTDSVIWLKLHCRVLNEDNGQSSILGGTIIDISETVELRRKLSQQSSELRENESDLNQLISDLKTSNERFNLATTGSSVGVWEWPIQGDTPFYWSPVYYELLGYEDQEITASYDAYRESVYKEDEEAFFDELLLCLKERRSLRVETRLRHKSGDYRWFLVSGQGQWGDDGQPIRMIGSIMDIDDLKISKVKALAYSKKLERANKELENFAYVASHDLKAPLRSMDNLAVWIEEDLGDRATVDISQKIALLRGRILRLEDMLKDILAFSYAGKNLTQPEELDLDLLLDEVMLWLSPPPNFKIVRALKLPKIKMVKTMMEQIFLNLISNSIKHHTKSHGIVIIEGFEVEDGTEFIITDDGPGISGKYYDYIFELFKTLRPRDKVAGSGIGLSIVKKMLDSINGKIWIGPGKSGTGTAFHFFIPNTIILSPLISGDTHDAI